MKHLMAIFASCFWATACRVPESNAPLYTLLPADSTGIDFRNDLEHTAEFNMYTYRNFYNGGGVGIGDINNDGLPDLFFCGNMVDNKLYLNEGKLKFRDITDMAGVASSNIWSTGVSFADVNGDGWLDIYVCKSGHPGGTQRHNELFLNNGDLTFTEVADQYGIADEGLSSHGAFFDYDRDGDLDLYLLNNSFRSVGGYDMREGLREVRDTAGGNKLYRNNLTEMKNGQYFPYIFTDVSAEAGIYGSNIGFGLGVTIGDINRDGWPDIYVSNDFFERDYLYINKKDGSFEEDLVRQMPEISMGSMGADMADINNDGLPEVFVTEMLPRSEARYKTKMTFENWDKYQLAVQNGYHHQFARNVLQLNNGNATFSEIGRLANVHATDWSWSALIADFDNDTYKDIYVSNGIFKDLLDQDYIHYHSNDPKIIEAIKRRDPEAILSLIDKIPSQAISNFAFQHHGDLVFEEVTTSWGLSYPSFSNGSAYGDLDRDGDLDLVVNNVNMEAFVFRNNLDTSTRHFLRLTLQGNEFNQFGIGAQITLYLSNDKKIYQELDPMRGFQSCIDHTLTIGLGAEKRIDSLVVLWPDGSQSTKIDLPANQHLILNQEESLFAIKKEVPQHQPLLMQEVSIPGLDFPHQETSFIDFDRDRLLFHMVSTEGPHVAVGDVNSDGLNDLYFCGSAGEPGRLLLQQADGTMVPSQSSLFEQERLYEDTDALFTDVDGDQDLDLLVVSGSNEFIKGSPRLEDRLYLNDGTGRFESSSGAFTGNVRESSSSIAAADMDQDGDLDLCIGTRLLPGVYGVPVSGYLWQNDGKGQFIDVTDVWAPELRQIGMITDLAWTDIDGDQRPDLIVVGEWMPVTIFRNTGSRLEKYDPRASLVQSNGLWLRVLADDLDLDGDIDLVLGNHGLNSRLKATPQQPLQLYINDFDDNKTAEQILTMYNGGKAYPLALRHDLVMQMPGLKKKYLYYEDYKEQTIEDIFPPEALRTAAKVEVYETASSIAWNDGKGQFTLDSLPVTAQFSPVYAILVQDFNHDGQKDILLGGNLHQSKPEIGIYAGSYGLLLTQKDGVFTEVPAQHSGIRITGDVRDIISLNYQGAPHLLWTRNQDTPVIYQVRTSDPGLIP